ncbi:MAG: SLC13 family permease [Chloroflexota bacterium]|jgi:Na+/H+ antiporter NhaD/arsenite permease-like protein
MWREIATSLIVVVVMYGIAVGRLPWLALNRPTLTIVGAAALLAIGALDGEQAWRAIDIPTLVILAGMMVINGALEEAGFFQHAAALLTRLAQHGRTLLGLIMLVSAVLSAIFLNDTVVFLLTPLVIMVARQTNTPPIPLLLGLALSANIGSTATITGNPQNIVIGNLSGIGFVPFLQALWVPSILSLFVAWTMVAILYRNQLTPLPSTPSLTLPPLRAPHALVAIVVLTVTLLLGVNPAVAVMIATGVLLVRRHTPAANLLQPIDGSLLLFFAALFIVTAGFRESATAAWMYAQSTTFIDGQLIPFAISAALLSNLISNVPAVLVLQDVIAQFANPDQAWLILAASSTLAGNSTLLASVANLIVAERAAQHDITLDFVTYLKIGLPVTLTSIAIAIWWLA